MIYITGFGVDKVDIVLDVLNITAKFPMAIYILYGLMKEPNTFQTCT